MSTRHFASRRGSRAITRPLVRLGARRIATQIAVSRYVADRVEGASTVVHAGVPTHDSRVPARARERHVLMVQRLEPEKNTNIGIRAFAESGLADSGWRLLVAGHGSQRRALGNLALTLGVDTAVDFLGHRDDIGRLMESAAVLLAPQQREGYGLVVVEAMAAGLPVVAAGSGGHLETVGALPDAALFDAGDSSAAADVLSRSVRDPEFLDIYGAALQALQRSRFTVTVQSTETEVVYRSVL